MNYKIPLNDMKRIWDIACLEWQPKISNMVTEYRPNEFSDYIILPEAIMQEMLKACTESQRPIVEEIFSGAGYKSDKNLSINEMAERYCGGVIANTTTYVGKDKAMISLCINDYGKFYLSCLFDWKIEGNTLIPTPKK